VEHFNTRLVNVNRRPTDDPADSQRLLSTVIRSPSDHPQSRPSVGEVSTSIELVLRTVSPLFSVAWSSVGTTFCDRTLHRAAQGQSCGYRLQCSVE
jgi:hypothetical protein